MNFHQKMAVAVLDVFILVELGLSVYLANLDPENFTPVFFKSFFLMLIPTLIVGRIIVKRLRLKEDSEVELNQNEPVA